MSKWEDMTDSQKQAIRDGTKKYRQRKRRLLATLTDEEWQEALDFFGNKDAYTGEPLVDPVKDHIVPVSNNGDYVRENIVPCNRYTNSSKGDKNMIEWFMKQPFFSEFRLQKILNWMGDYVEFLESPNGVSFQEIKAKKNQYFRITMPDGSQYTRTIRYFKSSNIQERIQILNNVIFSYWEEYLREYWLNDEHKKFNSTKDILDRCATFLLIGHFQDKENGYDIIGEKLSKSIDRLELSLSDAPIEIQNMFGQYGLKVDLESEVEDELEQTEQISVYTQKRRKNARVPSYRNSKSFRMNKLYSTKEVKTYRLTKLKNSDIMYTSMKDGMTEQKELLPPSFVVDESGNLSKERLKKWEESTAKNIFGQPVFDAEYLTIGGNVGIIDENNKYKSRWCTVDTENVFWYNNLRFEIDEKVEQYKVQKDNKSSMDKILVVPFEGKLVFFDQDIVKIPEDRVKQN